MNTGFLGPAVATVLTVYGIETIYHPHHLDLVIQVATVLTVYGIETGSMSSNKYTIFCCNSTYRLRY